MGESVWTCEAISRGDNKKFNRYLTGFTGCYLLVFWFVPMCISFYIQYPFASILNCFVLYTSGINKLLSIAILLSVLFILIMVCLKGEKYPITLVCVLILIFVDYEAIIYPRVFRSLIGSPIPLDVFVLRIFGELSWTSWEILSFSLKWFGMLVLGWQGAMTGILAKKQLRNWRFSKDSKP